MQRIPHIDPTIDDHLHQIFNSKAKNQPGNVITNEQFREILIQLGYDLGNEPNKRFNEILSGVKSIDTTSFSFETFKYLMINKFNFMSTRQEVEKAFSVFCNTSDCKISYDDLCDVLRLANPNLKKQKIDDLLNDVTKEEKEKGINYKNFVARLLNGTGDPITNETQDI